MLCLFRHLPGQDLFSTLKPNLYAALQDDLATEQLHEMLLRVLEEKHELRLGSAREFQRMLDKIQLPEADDRLSMQPLEQTVINMQQKVLIQPGPNEEGSDTHEFSDSVIEHLLQEVTPYLGPMAQRVVKRSTLKCTSVTELISDLATQIPNPGQQTDFLKKVRVPEVTESEAADSQSQKGVVQSSRTGAGSNHAEKYTLPEECLAVVNRLLTEYVGPMSTHISRRAIANAANWEEFSAQLTLKIQNEAEKANFLKRLNAIEHG